MTRSMNCRRESHRAIARAPKGGVVAIRPLIVHASSKSHAEMPRRVVHIEYAASRSIAEPLELALPRAK
jgi:hypothetical protein